MSVELARFQEIFAFLSANPSLISERHTRLWLTGCFRIVLDRVSELEASQIETWHTPQRVIAWREGITAVERYVDDEINWATLREIRDKCFIMPHDIIQAASVSPYYWDRPASLASASETLTRFSTSYGALTQHEVLATFVDVFGNSRHLINMPRAWRSSSAVGLARSMYESREFSPMPILADALEEAGCDHADILSHCRGDGPHVRGCWVVDLVLGKA